MAEEKEAEEAPAKKKKPILLIALAANLLLGGGAGAFFFLRSSSGGQAHAPAGEGDGHGEKDGHGADDGHGGGAAQHDSPRKARTQGPIVPFEPIVVNLNEPEGARYLKIALAVQLANDKLVDDVEDAKPVVRDHFIRELSDLNFRQTMGKKNKLSIKRRLIKRFNEAVGTDAAVDIHITQFIVQ